MEQLGLVVLQIGESGVAAGTDSVVGQKVQRILCQPAGGQVPQLGKGVQLLGVGRVGQAENVYPDAVHRVQFIAGVIFRAHGDEPPVGQEQVVRRGLDRSDERAVLIDAHPFCRVMVELIDGVLPAHRIRALHGGAGGTEPALAAVVGLGTAVVVMEAQVIQQLGQVGIGVGGPVLRGSVGPEPPAGRFRHGGAVMGERRVRVRGRRRTPFIRDG